MTYISRYVWLKQGAEIQPGNGVTVRQVGPSDPSVLVIQTAADVPAEGRYQCRARNQLGTALTDYIAVRLAGACLNYSVVDQCHERYISKVYIRKVKPWLHFTYFRCGKIYWKREHQRIKEAIGNARYFATTLNKIDFKTQTQKNTILSENDSLDRE